MCKNDFIDGTECDSPLPTPNTTNTYTANEGMFHFKVARALNFTNSTSTINPFSMCCDENLMDQTTECYKI